MRERTNREKKLQRTWPFREKEAEMQKTLEGGKTPSEKKKNP